MTERLLLVDFENVRTVDLSLLPHDVRVRMVLGAKIANLPTQIAIQAQSMGDRFAYVPIKGVAPNAVDFCIAFYLGEYLARNPEAQCVILSKDKGFDPLVKHLVSQRGFKVRRVEDQKEAFTTSALPASGEDPFERVLDLLTREKSRPLKRLGLNGKIKSYCPDLSMDERTDLVNRLVTAGKVAEVDGKLVYRI